MIRKANIDEYKILTEISFSSKHYWQYPEKYFEIWKDELTITQEFILKNLVFVYKMNGKILAYYSIVHLKDDLTLDDIVLHKGYWLEYMFVSPVYIGQGIGTALFKHMLDMCKAKVIREIHILADPNAQLFYEKMGCVYIEDYPSTIKDRTTPYLIKKIG